MARHHEGGTVLATQEWAVLIAMGAAETAPQRGPLSWPLEWDKSQERGGRP